MKRDVDKTFPFSFHIKLYLFEAAFTVFDLNPIDSLLHFCTLICILVNQSSSLRRSKLYEEIHLFKYIHVLKNFENYL